MFVSVHGHLQKVRIGAHRLNGDGLAIDSNKAPPSEPGIGTARQRRVPTFEAVDLVNDLQFDLVARCFTSVFAVNL